MKGRIPLYIEKINDYERLRGYFNNEVYYIIQSFYEMHQIVLIYEFLKENNSNEFLNTLKEIPKGKDFREEARELKKDDPRNFLYELMIAIHFTKKNFQVDLSTLTDIKISQPEIFIECKKIKSINKFEERLKKAIKQIISINKKNLGIIFIDITDYYDNLHKVFSINETGFPYSIQPPSSKDEIKIDINEEVEKFSKDFILSKKEVINNLLDDNIVLAISLNFVGFHLNIAEENLFYGQKLYTFGENPRLNEVVAQVYG